MSNLPAHSESGGPGDQGPDPAVRGMSWKARLGIVLVVLAVIAMIVLHLTGVLGPEGH
jgi:hypothetical protein